MVERGFEEHGREYPVTPSREYRPRVEGEVSVPRRVSWGSIFAGGVVALITQITLMLLGVAIGATTLDIGTEQQPFAGLGIGAAIWMAVSAIIAFFAGGWVAGRLTNIPRKGVAVLHGVVTWGLAMLVSFYFAGTAVTGLLGGVAGMVGQSAAGVAEGAASQPQGTAEQLQEKAQEIVPPADQLSQQAPQIGAQAAQGVAATAWGAFIVLVLGALAAAGGALVGRPKRVMTELIEPPVTH